MIRLLVLLNVFTPTLHASLVSVPDHFDPQTANLLVVLHGCLQTPESMALGTGFDTHARTSNVVVLYPRVPAGSQALDCWSWYERENQRPDSGQLRMLMDQVEDVKGRYGLRSPKVFVAGLSAGASMVSSLLACFPEAFTAGVVHSGTGYAMANGEAAGLRLMKSNSRKGFETDPNAACDPRRFKGRLLVIQGSFDRTVRAANARRILDQFFPGAQIDQRSRNMANGLPYSVREVFSNGQNRGRLIEVTGLTHRWAGSTNNRQKGDLAAEVPFFSRFGPSATDESWRFFSDSMETVPEPRLSD